MPEKAKKLLSLLTEPNRTSKVNSPNDVSNFGSRPFKGSILCNMEKLTRKDCKMYPTNKKCGKQKYSDEHFSDADDCRWFGCTLQGSTARF